MISGTGNSFISFGSVTDGISSLETETVSVASTVGEALAELIEMLSKVLFCAKAELASTLLLIAGPS